MERLSRVAEQADITRPTRRTGGGGGLSLSGPSAPPQDVRFPDHYTPPEDAQTFVRTGWWDSPAAVGTNVPAALTFRIPENMIGVLRSFSQYVNDMVIADDIRWAIRVNEAPIENWNDITLFPTLASFRTVSDDPFVKLPEGATISILLSNASGLAKRIGASYSGWYWPNRGRTRDF